VDIYIFDDPVLRMRAEPIQAITDRHREIAREMAQTMYAARGIGLAGPQVGLLERIIVVDVDWNHGEEGAPVAKRPLAMINPEILEETVEDDVYAEGCLSIPGLEGDVWRPVGVRVRYLTLDGDIVERECEDLLARCVQHEIDHLNGILFIDRMPPAERKKLNVALQQLADSPPPEGRTRSPDAAPPST
jgi:peptide deformylase